MIDLPDIKFTDGGGNSDRSALANIRVKSEDVSMFNSSLPMTTRAAPRNISLLQPELKSKTAESTSPRKRSFKRRMIKVKHVKNGPTESTQVSAKTPVKPPPKRKLETAAAVMSLEIKPIIKLQIERIPSLQI